MDQVRLIQSAISLTSLALLVVHILLPGLQVDAVSLALFGIGVLPWLAPLVASAKFPGGWEITFRDVAGAGEKATGPVPEGKPRAAEGVWSPRDYDANLALVGLRIELESRLRAVATKYGVPKLRSLHHIVEDLAKRNVIAPDAASGLLSLIQLGNRAAHGATVEPEVALWARDEAPRILAGLDALQK